MEVKTKVCTKCKVEKDVTEFSYTNRIRKDGIRPRHAECRECSRQRNREWIRKNPEKRKEYRDRWTSANRFKAALSWSANAARQGRYKPCIASVIELEEVFTGKCQCCGISENGERLCLDHDHNTGAFRGWLCRNCNHILGLAKDNAELLRTLAEYVKVKTLPS